MSPEVVEVTFKRNRKNYFLNTNDIDFSVGEFAIVEVDKGEDLGMVTLMGRLVMIKDIKQEPKKIIRKATTEDIEKLKENRRKETLRTADCL